MVSRIFNPITNAVGVLFLFNLAYTDISQNKLMKTVIAGRGEWGIVHGLNLTQRTDAKRLSPPSNMENRTIIIMSDSRPLSDLDYHSKAYLINKHYARLHGYHIEFYQMPCKENGSRDVKTCASCYHVTYGARSSPWCKLLALNQTMHKYKDFFSRVVYLDSDAFVNRLNETFHDNYFNKTLNMFANPNEIVPCSGIQLWRNTDVAREMIQAWWDSNTTFNVAHDYEQSVFHTASKILMEYHLEIGIIRESVREWNAPSTGFFRHITKKRNNNRARRIRMAEFMKVNAINNTL